MYVRSLQLFVCTAIFPRNLYRLKLSITQASFTFHRRHCRVGHISKFKKPAETFPVVYACPVVSSLSIVLHSKNNATDVINHLQSFALYLRSLPSSGLCDWRAYYFVYYVTKINTLYKLFQSLDTAVLLTRSLLGLLVIQYSVNWALVRVTNRFVFIIVDIMRHRENAIHIRTYMVIHA